MFDNSRAVFQECLMRCWHVVELFESCR